MRQHDKIKELELRIDIKRLEGDLFGYLSLEHAKASQDIRRLRKNALYTLWRRKLKLNCLLGLER